MIRRLLLATPLLLSGCDEFRGFLDQGTTAAFQRCMERAGAAPLNTFTARTHCIKQNERSAAIEIWGSGAYEVARLGTGYDFKITIWNKSNDYVLTSARVYLQRKAPEQTQSHLLEGLWIEPGFTASYTFTRETILTPPQIDDLRNDGKWGSSDARGIKIKI
mgnify:CR=1 FL=1